MTTITYRYRARADAWVRRVKQDPERPFYIEAVFEKRLARHRFWVGKNLTCVVPDPSRPMAVREFRDAVTRAKLTFRQLFSLLARMGGWTLGEIGNMLRMSVQAVCNTLRYAVAKVNRALRESPYYGLSAVYLSEVRRR